MTHTPKVAVVVPVFNCPDLLMECARCLLQTDYNNLSVVFVDNGSDDAETKQLLHHIARQDRRVVLVVKAQRGTFSEGVNVGVCALPQDTEYVVLYNQDVYAKDPQWLRYIIGVFQQVPNAGIVGCKLLHDDGTVQHAGIAVFPSGEIKHIGYRAPSNDPVVSRSGRVMAVTGAVMAIRKHLWDSLGGFSTDYTMGCEDIDFCFRAITKGYEVWYCHQAVLTHLDNAVKKRVGFPRDVIQSNDKVFLAKWSRWIRDQWGCK